VLVSDYQIFIHFVFFPHTSHRSLAAMSLTPWILRKSFCSLVQRLRAGRTCQSRVVGWSWGGSEAGRAVPCPAHGTCHAGSAIALWLPGKSQCRGRLRWSQEGKSG